MEIRMKFLASNFLEKELSIGKDMPIIYVGSLDVSSFFDEGGIDQHRVFGTDKFRIHNILSLRPFDEMVLIQYVSKSKVGDYFAVTIKTGGSDDDIKPYYIDAATLKIESVESEEQRLWFQQMTAIAFGFITRKKSVINLCEAKGSYRNKNGNVKYKKSKIIYVTDKKTLSKTTGIKTNISYDAHSVCGHPRNYYNIPGDYNSGLRLSYEGEDRNGNKTKGWTWITPYKTGSGAEIMNKIRYYK